MPAGERRFYLLGGKGGVGKTSLSASLATHMAAQGVPTLIVSTDPAHSLSDSLAQSVAGGKPVALSDTDLPIWGMEVEPEEARAELREMAAGDGGKEAAQLLRNVGMGGFAAQLEVRCHCACAGTRLERSSGASGRTSLIETH